MSEQSISKRCSHCKQIKPLSEFHKNKKSKDGYRSRCKFCLKQSRQNHKLKDQQYRKQYYQQNKAHIQQYRQQNKANNRKAQQKYCKSLAGYIRCVWRQMLYRCNNAEDKRYKYYGGRGIKVKFVSFDDFYNYVVKELKTDPRGLTIDRINNDGHYERGNIRFVTQAENSRNRRKKYKKVVACRR